MPGEATIEVSPLDFDRYVAWSQLLRELEIPVTPNGLPKKVRCPLCRRHEFGSYDDIVPKTIWHHCKSCQWSGNSLELAARAWNLSIPSAEVRLRRSGLLDLPANHTADALRYSEEVFRPRARFQAAWAAASNALPELTSPSLTRLREKFRLHSYLSSERWKAGPANLFGAAICTELSAALRTMDIRPKALLTGRGWDEVIVVPFHWAPDRLSGLWCLGRSGNDEDLVYVPSPSIGEKRFTRCGAACWWAADASHLQLGQKLVVCADTLLAIRLHLRHMAESMVPLPLLSFMDGANRRTDPAVWKNLEDRHLAFWGLEMSPGLLYQAIKAEADLAIVGPANAGSAALDHYVRNTEAIAQIRVVTRRARPWRVALAQWAERADGPSLSNVLLGLEAYGVDPLRIDLPAQLADFAMTQRELFAATADRVAGGSDASPIFERAGQLWKRGRAGAPDRLAMNAVLKISFSEMRLDANGKETPHHVGRLIWRGTEAPVEWPTVLRRDSVQQIWETAAVRSGIPILYVETGMVSDIVQYALLMAANGVPDEPVVRPVRSS